MADIPPQPQREMEGETLSPRMPGGLKKFGPVDPQRLRAAELLATTNLPLSEIAEQTGLPDAAAVQQAARLPQLQGFLSKHLDDAGATLEASAKVIADAHHATEIKVFSHNGEVVYSEPMEDHQTRLKASELNLKARGHLRENSQTFNLFADLDDATLAKIANGQVDPATLIDVGPRIDNPALEMEKPTP